MQVSLELYPKFQYLQALHGFRDTQCPYILQKTGYQNTLQLVAEVVEKRLIFTEILIKNPLDFLQYMS